MIINYRHITKQFKTKQFAFLSNQIDFTAAAMAEEPKPVNEDDLKQLKERMNIIASADPAQYHNDFSLRRYLRAFKTVDSAFQVTH